jgi:hypothetical protein
MASAFFKQMASFMMMHFSYDWLDKLVMDVYGEKCPMPLLRIPLNQLLSSLLVGTMK